MVAGGIGQYLLGNQQLRGTLYCVPGEAEIILILGVMHLLGLGCVAVLLLPALREVPEPPRPPDSGSDDGWGHGPPRPPRRPDRPRGGIPLPDAQPARVRLRDDHGRLGDRLPAPQRRPAREPARQPVRTTHGCVWTRLAPPARPRP